MKHLIKDGDRLIATIETHWDTVVVLHEPQPEAKPDYSHLIGKWVKYWLQQFKNHRFYGLWFRVNRVVWKGERLIVYVDGWDDEEGTVNNVGDGVNDLSCCFDLSNPRDTNPDEEERVIPFDIERWRKGDFGLIRTRNGKDIWKLEQFDCDLTPLIGLVANHNAVSSWNENGCFVNDMTEHALDLTLVVKGGSND
jgi:hypothetical protein